MKTVYFSRSTLLSLVLSLGLMMLPLLQRQFLLPKQRPRRVDAQNQPILSDLIRKSHQQDAEQFVGPSSITISVIAGASVAFIVQHSWRNRHLGSSWRSYALRSGGGRSSKSILPLLLLRRNDGSSQSVQKHDKDHILEELVNEHELITTTRGLCLPGKGLLALDELVEDDGLLPTVENTMENRVRFRETLLDAAQLSRLFSGAILTEEDFADARARNLLKLASEKGLIPGVRLDRGSAILQAGEVGETWTQGLDGLKARTQKCFEYGARFAKWRAAVRVPNHSQLAISEAAHGLAHFASICQSSGLVPALDIQILSQGDHTIDETLSVFEAILGATFRALLDFDVMLEALLLMPSFVLPGNKCAEQAIPKMVSAYTMAALQRHVPPAVPAVFFRSERVPEATASADLAEMNKWLNPWELSFAYACVTDGLEWLIWDGKDENAHIAQAKLLEVASIESFAQLGVSPSED
eukprot:TRINITY_DN44772_c0_g1_i1.p1 TRINITY_DN44772_c0_g1~~TRINITY_DN44772_c0_g1_i1.p1  ORF type:complete len:494 (+),score=82.31 TRINITY_DN44772_c0_g1_i1:77-1483(+)